MHWLGGGGEYTLCGSPHASITKSPSHFCCHGILAQGQYKGLIMLVVVVAANLTRKIITFIMSYMYTLQTPNPSPKKPKTLFDR